MPHCSPVPGRSEKLSYNSLLDRHGRRVANGLVADLHSLREDPRDSEKTWVSLRSAVGKPCLCGLWGAMQGGRAALVEPVPYTSLMPLRSSPLRRGEEIWCGRRAVLRQLMS